MNGQISQVHCHLIRKYVFLSSSSKVYSVTSQGPNDCFATIKFSSVAFVSEVTQLMCISQPLLLTYDSHVTDEMSGKLSNLLDKGIAVAAFS